MDELVRVINNYLPLTKQIYWLSDYGSSQAEAERKIKVQGIFMGLKTEEKNVRKLDKDQFTKWGKLDQVYDR